jgi:Deacetylase PdaC/Copper amine oxidase N-terminal domain/Protein of unknown function (DUF3298)
MKLSLQQLNERMEDMKKLKSITVISTLAMTLSLSSAVLAADNQVQGIVIDGHKVEDTTQMQNNTLLLPLRSIGEAGGYSIGWSAPDQKITLTKAGKNSVTISLSNQTFAINDHESFLQDDVEMINGTTYITPDFVREIMGYRVTQDGKSNVVELTSIQENPITIKNVKEKSQTDHLDLNIQYPQIEGLTNTKVQEHINKVFEKYSATAKSQALTNEKSFTDNKETKQLQTQTIVDYEIKYNQNNVLSVVFSHYEYTGGAHGQTVQSSYNFDLSTGHEYKLKDLYAEGKDYLTVITQSIKKQMDEQKQTESLLTPFEAIEADQAFYITDTNELKIYFQQYEYFPYSMGMPEYTISFDGYTPIK